MEHHVSLHAKGSIKDSAQCIGAPTDAWAGQIVQQGSQEDATALGVAIALSLRSRHPVSESVTALRAAAGPDLLLPDIDDFHLDAGERCACPLHGVPLDPHGRHACYPCMHRMVAPCHLCILLMQMCLYTAWYIFIVYRLRNQLELLEQHLVAGAGMHAGAGVQGTLQWQGRSCTAAFGSSDYVCQGLADAHGLVVAAAAGRLSRGGSVSVLVIRQETSSASPQRPLIR